MRCNRSSFPIDPGRVSVAGIKYEEGADPTDPGPGRQVMVARCQGDRCSYREVWYEDQPAPRFINEHEVRNGLV